MDISAEHDNDDAQARLAAAAQEHSVDGTQVDFTVEQKTILDRCGERAATSLQRLEELSTPEAQYGVPADIQRSALCNALARVLVDAGLLTLPDLAVRKEEAMADILEEVVANAQQHAAQIEYQSRMADIAQPASALNGVPPLPPRKAAARRRRGH